MYSSSHPVSTPMNSHNGMGPGMIDGGTINPAQLNTSASVLPTPTSISASSTSPRGTKRSRSPEQYNDLSFGGQGDDDDQKPRKRGRPPKSRLSGGSIDLSTIQTPQSNPGAPKPTQHTPALQTQGLPQQNTNITPTQSSPNPRATPNKSVIKALPTVRDHTTDQLTPEGDEYVPKEFDEAGEKKVSPNGRPLDGREYKCRTFLVPNRGDKLFMLATECARVLGYRDSYLLFNKNRSLYKIIATQPEKDDLIAQEVLPYSYRSRQIAIVTAKSMFRQFGSRVIANGRRVRDDYWEAKARKQGFTEEDLAGEKRPGGAKAAREAQAAEAASAAAMGHHQDIVYSNGPGTIPIDAHGHPQFMQAGMGGGIGQHLAPLPMITMQSDDMRGRDYSNVSRPRQEITGAPYQDRTHPSSSIEIMSQAQNAAEFNKALNQQSGARAVYMNDYWRRDRPQQQTASTPVQQTQETSSSVPQSLQQSPPNQPSSIMSSNQPPMLPQQSSQMIAPQAYAQNATQQQQAGSISSPSRSVPQQGGRAEQLQQQQQQTQQQHQQQRSSGLSYAPNNLPQTSSYAYQPSSQQMWGQPPPQPQPSSLPSHQSMSQYSPQTQTGAPHASPSPHHSQSPHGHPPPPPPTSHHPQQATSGSMHSGSINYQALPNMGQTGYGGMNLSSRGLYQQAGQSSHFMPNIGTTAGGAANLQGWAPTSQHGQQQAGQPPQYSPGGQPGWQ